MVRGIDPRKIGKMIVVPLGLGCLLNALSAIPTLAGLPGMTCTWTISYQDASAISFSAKLSETFAVDLAAKTAYWGNRDAVIPGINANPGRIKFAVKLPEIELLNGQKKHPLPAESSAIFFIDRISGEFQVSLQNPTAGYSTEPGKCTLGTLLQD